jgi:Xaa-Pro aminopeptidase
MLLNRDRANAYMRQYQLDALVATSPVNITYFTDYYCWLDPLHRHYMATPGAGSRRAQMYAILPLDGEPALVLSSMFAVNAADLWVHDLYPVGDAPIDYSSTTEPFSGEAARFGDLLRGPHRHATATAALCSILQTGGLSRSRLGLEMEDLPPAIQEEISCALPMARFLDCTNLIRLIRTVKSEEELARMAGSAQIAERAALESVTLGHPGASAGDLAQHFRARVAELGAAFDHFAYGMDGMGIGTEPSYVPRQGEALYLDFGCVAQRYFSDAGTTLVLGEPSAAILARHAALQHCIAAGRQTLRPGVAASVVWAAMAKSLHDQGISVSNPQGHGLGLELRDYPIIVANNGLHIRDGCVDLPSDLVIEANMVINLEASVFRAGQDSVHIEQSFLVTPEGCLLLVPQDRSHPLILA